MSRPQTRVFESCCLRLADTGNSLPRHGPSLEAPDLFEQDGDVLLTPTTSNKWADIRPRLGVEAKSPGIASHGRPPASIASPMLATCSRPRKLRRKLHRPVAGAHASDDGSSDAPASRDVAWSTGI